MRVTVDLTRCQGYANCLAAAPDVFDLDDNALVKLLVAEPDDAQHANVRKAAALCPVKAIALQEASL